MIDGEDDIITPGNDDSESINNDTSSESTDISTSDKSDSSDTSISDNSESSTNPVNEEESILNPEYVKKVKESQFGELYGRLTSDEKESQCAEFLAPQLLKQDRLYKHTFNAAFGSFY